MKAIKTKVTVICVTLIVMGLLLIASSYAEIDSKSIVGAWLFDEGNGDIAKDSSGNGIDGEIVGGAKWLEIWVTIVTILCQEVY
ncbi:hypothetical protein H8E77_00235 [bacterium]|nr:hypothetical protein [bacterium]